MVLQALFRPFASATAGEGTPADNQSASHRLQTDDDGWEDLGLIWAEMSEEERRCSCVPALEEGHEGTSRSALSQRKMSHLVVRRLSFALQKIWLNSHRSARVCVACLEPIRGVQICAPCGHFYDKDCIISFFEASTRDETLFHPRCCKKLIPFRTVRKHFTPALQMLFVEKSKEYRTEKRVYCACRGCDRFLGPQLERKMFRTRKAYKCTCGRSTCSRCRNARHDGVKHTCSDNSDEGAETVLTLGKAEGWARCPGCRTMIELGQGCYHIMCVCKVEFCYLCQTKWKTCACPQWDDTQYGDIA